MLLAMLSLSAETATWSFEWNKSHSDATSQGFYNFGTSFVTRDVYTATLGDMTWSIASEGTKKYAYTAKSGQTIGTSSDPSTHTTLWTDAFEGRIVAVRVQARTNKDEWTADLSVVVAGDSLRCGGATRAALTGTLAEYAFAPSGEGIEGRVEINIDPTSETKGTLYIKRIEVDYEPVVSSVPMPTFTPAAGTYDAPQQVTLSAEGLSAEAATFYYTTDGSNPRVSATRVQYGGPITVDTATTLRAATRSGEEYSAVATAGYVIRRAAQLSFYKDSISLISGEDGYADLINPHKLSPITYKSSAWDVCSVDDKGMLASSYVTRDSVVTITATFAGNDEFLPDTASMRVLVIAKQPLKTPVVTPLGGTFDAPAEVTVSTDDDNAVTIWYSTTAKDAEEFMNDNTKSVITEAKTVTFTVDKTCTLYVMTRGYNTESEVVTADFVVNEALSADFTTDNAAVPYYTQGFDSADGMADWTVGDGWRLKDKGFSAVDAADVTSLFIGYNDGSDKTTLTSPVLDVKDNSTVEFYAHFSGVYLVWGSWQFTVTDVATGESKQLLDAFDWAQENAYTGPNWNKFAFSLGDYAGRQVTFQFTYNYGGEDLAIDGFRLTQSDPSAATAIHIFEGDSIAFHSLAKGDPDALEWTFPGGSPVTSSDTDPVITYKEAGTYDVTLTARRGEETASQRREAFVVVSQKAPTALIGLPEEGYESPYVGVFVPTEVPVTFRDLSTGHPTEWAWTFQHTDVTSSTDQNPTVTFVDKGRFSVALTAKNAAGESSDMLAYAIQAGGAQYVWNIGMDENQSIEKIAMGWYGNYAGSNWLGIDKFAERYKAPLADATIDSVAVFFASNSAVTTDAAITLSVNAVAENGEPGEVLATTSLGVGDLRCEADTVLATVFHFDEPVTLKKGTPFFIVVGPFPNGSQEVSPYDADDIAIYCVRRQVGERCTAWNYLEDQDNSGTGLGTYKWTENVDDPVSMAIAPVISYDPHTPTSISGITGFTGSTVPVAIYDLSGRRVTRPAKSSVYVVRQADGTVRKMVWK